MKRCSRALLTAAGATVVAVVTVATASAAGFLGPGHFSTDVAGASAVWSAFPYTTVNVDRNTFVFRPSHNGAGGYVQHATLMYVTVKGDFFGQDCFVIPDTAFIESNGVQGASLNVTVDSSELCQNQGQPVSAVLGDSGVKGGPPPGQDLPLPMTVAIAWTGNGVTSYSSDAGQSACGGFNSENQTSMESAIASASGTLSFPLGVTITLGASDFGSVDSGRFNSNVQGYPNPLCYGI